jgi:hypothetical protein
MEAVKIWNAEHNAEKWCIPRKDTSEYREVRAIMEGKPSPKKVKASAERREKAVEQLRVVEKEVKERNKSRKEMAKVAFPPTKIRRDAKTGKFLKISI